MRTAILPAEVRQARAFLQQAGVHTSDIAPRHFVAVSHEMKKSFRETLRYLALLLSGGSGDGPSPIATAGKDRLDPVRAIGNPTPSQAMEYDVGSGT